MKKNREPIFLERGKTQKLYKVMKLSVVLMIVGMMQVSAAVYSQNEKVTVKEKNISLSNLLWKLQKQTEFVFTFNSSMVEAYANLNVDTEGKLEDVLRVILKDTDLDFQVKNGIYVINRKTSPGQEIQQPDRITITGTVKDTKGQSIPGVNVYAADRSSGTITDENGRFELLCNSDVNVIVASFIGMVTKEVSVVDSESVTIVLQSDIEEIGDVVVTGYYERNKNTFTGAAKTVSGEDLRKISTSNVIRSLGIVDPAIVIVENNNMGSNPNHLPEIIIRGTTSLNASNEAGVNSPLIVIDGVETNIRALYDMDIFEIESVTVLKDASATALYGEQASNGVILVTRKKTSQKEVRASYNFSGSLDFADLSEYSLMDASQKLELERLSGLYDSPTGALDTEYNEKLARVNSGVDTDWIAKPLRTAFSQTHTFNVTGRGSGMSYGVNGRYGNTNGVMKDDFRKNMSLGFYFSYNHNQKFIATFRSDYNQTDSKDSKYGSFNSYAKANPYDAPYDIDGELIKELSYGLNNPLYEASLSSFGKSKAKVLTASLDLRWNIKPGLYATANGNISSNDTRSDSFISPNSNSFVSQTDPAKKGSYALNASDDFNYYLKGAINYNKNLDESGSMVTFNVGGEVRKNSTDPYGFVAEGFFNDMLTDLSFATSFP